MPLKLLCVAGARPNFMKLAPLYAALAADPFFEPILVHTGQHYDDAMSGQFFRDLVLSCPFPQGIQRSSGITAVLKVVEATLVRSGFRISEL
jgi:UDP-N-acetylglucosamine 2-epimerase